ncbi:hypothetical protein EV193_104378 [Herbihabitans rhizosphaerae]|uniref:Uncharacterized protein n=1 Tax=Herbihabitans rhizosphaerae TaxID=1872711 RepID=A0A4Q7KUK0_9PSEU|nr:hypothetical protein [Herbihabitans rhizosphaerae]RZS39162.1 hypothetical protein EV193_104378 [Herbihabitans rhizosphaerae]
MALRVFETDPDAKPKPRDSYDYAGRFRSGMLVGRQPKALSEWRVTTDDPDVADKIAAMFGGEPAEWDTEKSDNIQVMTDTKKLDVIVDGPSALRSRMAQYGTGGPIHVCDGVQFISGHPEDEEIGDDCGCPRSLEDRKAKAKKQIGPKPDIRLVFRLADDPDLGVFMFTTGSWSLVKILDEVESALAEIGGPARVTLELAFEEYDTKAGRHVEYTWPKITVTGAAE